MKFLDKYRYWLFTTVLVLAAGLMGLWAKHSLVPGEATQSIEQKQATWFDLPTASSSTGTDNTQQNAIATHVTLPPIPAEMATEIRKLSNRSYEGLTEEKHADGSVTIDLQGRFRSVTAAVRGPDGKIIIRHGEDFLDNVQANSNTPQP